VGDAVGVCVHKKTAAHSAQQAEWRVQQQKRQQTVRQACCAATPTAQGAAAAAAAAQLLLAHRPNTKLEALQEQLLRMSMAVKP
jgi:hypothetical protein